MTYLSKGWTNEQCSDRYEENSLRVLNYWNSVLIGKITWWSWKSRFIANCYSTSMSCSMPLFHQCSVSGQEFPWYFFWEKSKMKSIKLFFNEITVYELLSTHLPFFQWCIVCQNQFRNDRDIAMRRGPLSAIALGVYAVVNSVSY